MTDILYKDEYICVCKKPRGTLSEGNGENCLPLLLSKELGGSIFPVHRLDKETSGIMVFARTREAAAALSADIAEGRLVKEYIAELCGTPEKSEDELFDLIFYDRSRGKSFVVNKERQGVKAAGLYYRVISAKDGYTTVRVRLYTGRTHQIRVQFASRGLPLRGDRRYGAPKDSGDFTLCACYLKFNHPITKKEMEFGKKESKNDRQEV